MNQESQRADRGYRGWGYVGRHRKEGWQRGIGRLLGWCIGLVFWLCTGLMDVDISKNSLNYIL